MNIRLFILVGFSSLAFFKPLTAWGSNADSMLNWFCRAQLSALQSGIAVHTDEPRWSLVKRSLFERHFPKELIDPSVEEQDVARCVERYAADFEQAEFILSGLKVLDQSLNTPASRDNVNPASATVDIEGFEVKTALVSPPPDTIDAAAVQSRRENYLRLWNHFTENLRERLGSTFVAGH